MTGRRRRLAATALGALVLPGAACADTRAVLDVVLEPVVARAVADDVADGHLGFSWVDEDGDGDGLGATAGAGFTLSSSTDRLSFTVRLDDAGYTRLRGLGRTGFVAVRDDAGVALSDARVRVLLAPADRVGLLVDVPVALGGDECVVGDEAGRLFAVGGSAGNQGGYVVDDFGVKGLDDADRWTRAPLAHCGASGGSVAAVVGCGAPDAEVVVAGDHARVVALAAVEDGAPVSCAARVAPVDDGVWVADGAALSFVGDDAVVASSTSSQPPSGASAGFGALLATTAGEAVVVDGVGAGGVLRVVRRNGAARVVRTELGATARLGRRFDDVLLLDGAVLVGLDGDVVRDDVPAELSSDDVTAFVVLSDGTVVALAGREVRVSTAGQATKRLSLATSRAGLAALAGDTVVLAGGNAAGVDVVALSEHQVLAPR